MVLEWPPGSSHQELSYPFFTFFFLFFGLFLILDAPRNRRRTERYKNKIKLVFAGGEIPFYVWSLSLPQLLLRVPTGVLLLSRWPRHWSSTQQVDVQMHHFLSTMGPIVDDDTTTIRTKAHGFIPSQRCRSH